jgi:hypothetical protein
MRPPKGHIRGPIDALLGLALVVAACAPVTPVKRPPDAGDRPPAAEVPARPPVARPTSRKSALLRSYLHQVEQAQLGQGLLRQDGGGADTPFTADILARNFEQIALFDEYDGNFIGRGGASPLRRWTGPVRMKVVFGDGVPPSQRKSDQDDVNRFSRRLARATGHPISSIGDPNFLVVIASEDDRADALSEVVRRLPGITPGSLRALRNMRRDTYCAVAAYAGGPNPNVYTAAVAVIRAENPDLLRLSCLHEELAQGLGLANDSPAARPSIFNDDDEFALLTRHDELLLQMLYDERLRPGMKAQEVRPIARIIARELTQGPL